MAESLQSGVPTLPSPLDDPILRREWMAIAWSSEIPRGAIIARRILGVDLVLWRSAEGLHCWRDLCIHRGARLSLGTIRPGTVKSGTTQTGPIKAGQAASDCLICPYHAWEYAPGGQCVHIPAHPGLTPPAKARAEVFAVRERYGVVWVALDEPQSSAPEFPLADEPGVRIVLAGPYRFQALGPRVIENFLDVAHLGFVHAGLLGDPGRGEIEDYEVTPGDASRGNLTRGYVTRGPEARDIPIWQPNPDGTGGAALVHYHYWVSGALTAAFVKSHGAQRFGILIQAVPIDETTTESRLVMCMNYGHDVPEAELARFQDLVTEQDRAVVESQRPELLPLDLQAELHLRSDRMAIAYRKWLRELGLHYGTEAPETQPPQETA
jgi:phenylpropionate dioxygenase-like ring-hydroxylating dioxygenase large terminal subunit